MRRKVAAACAALVTVVGLAGCAAEETAAGKARAAVDAPAEEGKAGRASAPAKVEIVSAEHQNHDTWGPDAFVVKWELTNTGDTAGDFYAGLDFVGADQDVLGSTGITADKVGPGKTATGETAPLEVEIDKGKIADITGVKVTEIQRLGS
jgi:hypothetical protein